MNLAGNNKKLPAVMRGFTLIEIMITVAIIAILATLTIPSNLAQRQRAQVAEAVRMSETIINDVTKYYSMTLSFPADNEAAGLPEANLLIGNNVTSIEVEDGAIHIVLGNKVVKPLQGRTLTIRPAVVTGSPTSPISWVCANDKPVPGMEAIGVNKTDLPNVITPASCGR